MKFLHLTVALSSFLISPIYASPLLAGTAKIVAQNTEIIDEPFCYMKTPEGKTVNLGTLCEKKPVVISEKCVSGSNISAKILITNVNYDGQLLSGTIINQGCKIVKNIKVNYQVLDELGNVTDNGFIDAQPVAIEPGKSAAFRGEVIAGVQVRATHADGQE